MQKKKRKKKVPQHIQNPEKKKNGYVKPETAGISVSINMHMYLAHNTHRLILAFPSKKQPAHIGSYLFLR